VRGGVAVVAGRSTVEAPIPHRLHVPQCSRPPPSVRQCVRESVCMCMCVCVCVCFAGKGCPGLENVDWSKDVYPMFVNEAAYYEQGCACALAQKCE